MLFEQWIEQAYALGASDLHLEADTPIVARIRGELQVVGAQVTGGTLQQVARDLLGDQWAQFVERGSADLSETVGGIRLRVNFYQTVRGIAAAIRLLAPSVKDLRVCNLHKDLRKFIEPSSGLVIISGPTGAGKSTTLAALIEEINSTRARHIVTLESPIEYLFSNRQSFIRQREIPTHAPSFEQGIVDALRENPDVMVISEMRTPEVMRLTLNAAETGHLVLATMHSSNCAEALSRLCMSFPSDIQASVRAQLADCLVAVLLSAARVSERAAAATFLAARFCCRPRARAAPFAAAISVNGDGVAVGRGRRHVDLRALWALDGSGDRLGAPSRVLGAARRGTARPAPPGACAATRGRAGLAAGPQPAAGRDRPHGG